MKMKRITALAAIMALAATGAQATILQNWQYNDAAGTLTKDAVNTGTPGDLSFSATDLGTNNVINGTGLSINTSAANVTKNVAMPTHITSGKVFLRVDYAYWNLISTDNNAVIGEMGFLDAAGKSVIQRVVKGKSSATPANNVTVASILSNPGGTPVAYYGPAGLNMGMIDSTGISVILGIDLTAQTYALWTDYGFSGTYTQKVDKALEVAIGDLTQFRYLVGGGVGNVRALDMVVVGTDLTELMNIGNTPSDTPQSLYADWVSSFTTLTNTTDNPDGDAYNNLAEYALGGNPTNAVDNGYEPTFSMVTLGGTNWMQYVHAQYTNATARGLTYSVEHNENLVSSGSWTNTAIIAAGSGALDADFNVYTNRADATGQPQRFLKLKIESSF